MAFILLLLISLTTFVRVETKTASVALDRLQARQNALLGLQVALGNLQKYAGPDQRVTAQAGLFPNTDPTREHLVGVWMADESSPQHGERLVWLVSGSEPSRTETASGDWPILVEAIAESSPGAGDGAAAVRAEPREISGSGGNREGGMAWWISDEGAKASLGAGDAERLEAANGASSDPDRLRAARRTAPEVLPQFSAYDDAGNWARADFSSDLPLLWTDAAFGEALERGFHDFTARSLGVLANVRNGGLKKDLTAGLQAGSSAMEDDTGSDLLFPPQWTGGSDQDPGGPMWEQLRDFYNTRVSGTGAGELAFQRGTDEQLSLAPVVTWAVVGAHAIPANAAGDTVRFYAMPAFRFWNPYQHRLRMPPFVVSYFLGRPRWYVEDAGGTRVDSSFPLLLQWRVPATTWEPGESITFTLDEHAPHSALPTLSRGWRSGFGSYQDVSAGGPLSGNLTITTRHFRPSQLFLSESAANPTENYFLVMARLFNFGGGREKRTISGSAGAVAPPSGTPLLTGVHGDEIPALTYSALMKFAEASTDKMAFIDFPEENLFLGHYNSRGAYAGGTLSEFMHTTSSYTTMPLYTSFYGRGDTDYANTGSSAVGYSATLPGPQRAAYFSFPHEDETIVSLGRLADAHLARDPDYDPDFSVAANDDGVFTDTQPSFAIGNSLADPRVPNDRVFRNWNDIYTGTSRVTGRGTEYDHSYLLNEALWDRYFFSGVPRNNPNENFTEEANPRLLRYGDPSDDELLGYDTAAQSLLVDGPFNVHATSTEAWRTVLAAFRGERVATLEDGVVEEAERTPFVRPFRPLLGRYDPGTDDEFSEETHAGYRALTDDEVKQLAEAMVASVKERVAEMGRPFLSMAEFVNRSLESQEEAHRLKGVVQQAIDATAINADLSGGSLTLDMTASEKAEMAAKNGTNVTGMQAENAEGDLLFGVPGYFMQADLLAKFGHILTVRSDTFRIRAYGSTSVTLASGDVATARCEAIVQRLPEAPAGSFGRPFKFISFRWLE